MNARSRLLFREFLLSKTNMSTKTKGSSHYDTLEVNPRATQSEIKSAYFKLSKQYHPDVNTDAAATTKFQTITEAYEILGNFDSRKIYDRSRLTGTREVIRRQPGRAEDPKAKYYQQQVAIFRQSQKFGATPMYDFDEWTREHYGDTFQRQLRDKKYTDYKRMTREFSDRNAETKTEKGFISVAVLCLAMILVLMSLNRTDYDERPEQFISEEHVIDKDLLKDLQQSK